MPQGIYKRNKESRKIMSDVKKEWWNNPDNKDEIEKERKRRSKRMKNWWNNPDNKKETDEIRKKCILGINKWWDNPKNRKDAKLRAKIRYDKMDKKLSDYVKLDPILVKEIEYQYRGGCNYRDMVALLGINRRTAVKYIKEYSDRKNIKK